MKKFTEKEVYEMIKGIVENSSTENQEEIIKFVDKKLNQIETKRQKAKSNPVNNEPLIEKVYEVLSKSKSPLTITDIQGKDTELEKLSNQKVSFLLTKLVNDQKVNRIKKTANSKKVTLFEVVKEG